MSVKDVIKKSILEADMYQQAISMGTIVTMIVDLVLALAVGLCIYHVYKAFYKGVVYSKNFAITLVGLTVLTSTITLAISTNVVISLGMVGALSIVRYRTAIKEPLDLMYVFWAITSGISIGASMYILVVLSFGVMYLLVLFFSKEKLGKQAYLCIVHYTGDDAGDDVLRCFENRKIQIRSKVLRGEQTELTVQLECKNQNTTFMENIRAIQQVDDVTLLAFDGEYHG